MKNILAFVMIFVLICGTFTGCTSKESTSLDTGTSVETVVSENTTSLTEQTDDSASLQTTTSLASEKESFKKPVQTSKPAQTSPSAQTSKPEESKSTHIHEFSAATCTAPQKCLCGETKGSALGHKWQEATCKSPKTCNVCKATEGTNAKHKYENYVCVYCGSKDEEGIAIATNPRLSFKPKMYTTKYSDDYLTEIGLFVSTITFGETMGWSGRMYWSTEYINSPHFPKDEYKDIMSQEYIVYNGNKYYLFTGSGDSCVDWSYELTDKYIIVFEKGQQILKFTLNLDGTLYVVESKETGGHLEILVGTTLI